jgi:peptidoglycan/LPS O-acetylase OafA/YrhL
VLQLPSLTGLRAIAALWVVGLHYLPSLGSSWWSPLLSVGHLGVALFFILSGFVVSHVYAGRLGGWAGYGRFLWFRFARLWPLHAAVLLALAAAAAFGFMQPRPENTVGNLLASLAMVHAWSPFAVMSWNYPSWSISAEWAAYLAFPAAWAIASRAPFTAASLACAAWIAIAADGTPKGIAWSLPQVFSHFTLGCCAYALYSRRFAQALPWSAVVAACFVLIVAAAYAGLADPWATPLFAVLILGLAYERGPWLRVLGSRPMAFWGDASYAIYLLHLPVYHALREFGAAACLAVTLVLAGLAYGGLERPARQALRGLLAERAPAH